MIVGPAQRGAPSQHPGYTNTKEPSTWARLPFPQPPSSQPPQPPALPTNCLQTCQWGFCVLVVNNLSSVREQGVGGGHINIHTRGHGKHMCVSLNLINSSSDLIRNELPVMKVVGLLADNTNPAISTNARLLACTPRPLLFLAGSSCF